MQNEKYADSYRQEAKKIKNRKIWKNFQVGIPIGTLVVPLIILGVIAGQNGGGFM